MPGQTRHFATQHFAVLLAVLLMAPSVGRAEDAKDAPKLKKSELGSTRNVHSLGSTLLCGQPSVDDFSKAKKRGIKTVISLRQPGEIDWDQAGELKKLGLEFHRVGFRAPETLTDEVFDRVRKLLKDAKDKPVLLHCGSANRVGAVWAAHRVLDHKLSLEEALQEARQVGLRTPGYEKRVREYVNKQSRP